MVKYITVFCVYKGWQWDPKDRPDFKEIHFLLENMFDSSNIIDGE